MAEIAEAKADHVIVTNDNPRKESEHKIVEDITSGFKSNNSFNKTFYCIFNSFIYFYWKTI